MDKPLFTGACTALVTPFLGRLVNFPMLEQLIKRQVDNGIRAIVLCGTTGESATLSDEEKLEIIRKAKEYIGSDALIIAGTGSNSTTHAAELSFAAEKCGADALLVVSPYYNKATQDGLCAHYRIVAGAVDIPVIMYNVPSRTGVDIPVSCYQEMSAIENIAGVKEASRDIVKFADVRSRCPRDFAVWSGNDDMIVPAMSLGAAGVISVLANIKPAETAKLTQAALQGDYQTAAWLQLEMLPLIEALFSDVNPSPVKTAMKLIGYDCGECRLPLTSLSREKTDRLRKTL